jgi:hypothetical protein
MTDSGNDAGFWLAGLTDLTPMVPNGFDYGILSLPLDKALEGACTDPAGAAAAIDQEAALTNAKIVFVGAHLIPTPMYPWNVDCIARLPNLRLITSARWQGSMAAAFAIVR